MKKKFYVFLLTIIVIITLLVTGICLHKSTILADENINNDYNFIFVCSILDNEYWVSCIDGMQEADKELGTKTKVIGPKSDEDFSTEIIKYMRQAINEHPDGIIAYSGIKELFPLIDEATSNGIPVLSIDSDAPSTSRIAFVGTDPYNSGYNAGEKMVELTNKRAKIGVLISSKSAEKEMRTINAFSDAIHDYNIEIVDIKETNGDQMLAEEQTRQMLKEHPEITAIFCTSAYDVTGAAYVKKELKLNNLVLVGFDDTEENLQFVRDGIINAILVQKIRQTGYQSVSLMKEYLDNGFLPEKTYDTSTIIVTNKNVNTYYSLLSPTIATIKDVKLGYYESTPNFQTGAEDNVRKSGYAYDYLQEIAGVAGWNYTYVYGSRSDIIDLLKQGDIDIVAGVYKTNELENKVLFSDSDMGLEGANRYFAVNSKRKDLLEDLNYAIEQLEYSNPTYITMLLNKFYSQTTEQVLSDYEKNWLSEKNTIKIGYIKNHLPLSDTSFDNKPTGVIKDLIDMIQKYLSITVEPVCYENILYLEDALKNGDVDTAFPIYSDQWLNESRGFRQTDAFINDRIMIVYTGNYSSDLLNKVALSKIGIGQRYYMEINYPDSTINLYDSRVEALDAILSGKERCLIGCSSTLQHFLKKNPKYNELNIAYLDSSENFGMAVKNDDIVLYNVLNKAIRQMDDSIITSSMLKYADTTIDYTFKDFVQRYSFVFIGFLAFLVIFSTTVFVLYHNKSRKFNKQQIATNKALEEALKSAETANDAKTKFLSSMSHDIRTPMNAIIGMTNIANQNINDKEKVSNCLEKIDLSSKHLLTLINNILDISKIESGKLQLNPTVFSLRDTINTIIDVVQPQIESKQIDFVTNVNDLQNDNVYADEVRINQIFMNILTNAIKYTDNGGKISLSMFDELLENNLLRVTYIVKDNGIGMTEEFMKNMYDVFSRAEDSRIAKIQGTGLGLAIVKQMVDMMDGTITCDSKQNEGTTFTIQLTLQAFIDENINSSEKSSDYVDINVIKNLHLLIAEDNDLNWEIISELLHLYEITADRAENGQICVDMLCSAPQGTYDLILMDIQMPIMDGRAATKLIRSDTRNYIKNIPIIAMTADAFAEDIVASLKIGMNGHVSKPVDMDKLFQEIYRVLNEDKS